MWTIFIIPFPPHNFFSHPITLRLPPTLLDMGAPPLHTLRVMACWCLGGAVF